MSGGAIIAPRNAGELDSSLAGMCTLELGLHNAILTFMYTAVHSTRREIKGFKFNLMVPVKNPLFCAFLLVFVWPYIWRHGTPRQKEVYTYLFTRIGPVIMRDLADKLDPAIYVKIKPSWDDLQRHSRIVEIMNSTGESHVDWVQESLGFRNGPDEYNGDRYRSDGSLMPFYMPYSSDRTIVFL